MKHFFFYSLFTVLALLTSCQEYDLGYTPEQIGYNITFRKDFGDYDMANDFNLAQRGQVTVTSTACPEVCIYSKAATGWQLVAKYDNVAGTQTLGFDIPKGVSEVMVTNGSATQKTTIGGSVVFAGTRVGSYDANNGVINIELNEGRCYTYYYYDKEEATDFSMQLPEEGDNRGKAIQDFALVSTGEFVIYPTYWNCGLLNQIGIYYYDSNGDKVVKPLFYNKEKNESVQYFDQEEGVWVTSQSQDNNFPFDSHMQFRSKGIIVNLPVGTRFGFTYYASSFSYKSTGDRGKAFLEHGYSKYTSHPDWSGRYWIDKLTMFSEMDLNPYFYLPIEAYKDFNFKWTIFATYFDNRGDMVIGLEDGAGFWNGATGAQSFIDMDYNDVVFKLYGSVPEVLDNSSQSWILPFEDLGGSFDWDFNDVILKMNYVSGQKTAKITPIAAGGTLHSEVFFNDTDDESKTQDLGEIHVLLGAEPVGDDELYEPINASHRGTPGTVKTVNITDPATFSIANAQSGANSSANGTSTKSMVGTYIVTKGNSGLSTIAYNGMGKAPAMLVLPTTYKIDDTYYEWAWPVENKDIRSAYGELGHSFVEWVADHTKAQDWYKYPTGGTVEERSASSSINTLVPSPEYDMDDYGTIISLPSKNSEGVYAFPANIFNRASTSTVTVVLKGVLSNALYAYDGSAYSDAIGEWSRLNNGGTITVMGNNASGSGEGSVNYEGMYQITLDSSDLSTIASAGQWVVSAGDNTQILYIAYKNGEVGGVIDDVEWGGQEEEPGSSNDPANGSEPVLAPIR